ncbi:hypothetical protein LJB97_01270 [Parabacteroides sp. OttesenSCG-928-O15]|nr:hypothetical protein [Parabacteroides sp. OttesenSCG-928-O15]
MYYGIVACNTHIHIENGVTIVHAHPFQKAPDQTPHTHHSLAEIVLFHALSSIHALDGAVHTLIVEKSIQPITFVFHAIPSCVVIDTYLCNHSLRAPPIA